MLAEEEGIIFGAADLVPVIMMVTPVR